MGRTVDMTGVGDYQPAPAGIYGAEFTGGDWAEIKKGENAGKEMFRGKWTITDETAETGESVAGKVVFRNWMLTPNSLWVFKNDATALGFPPEELEGEVDLDVVIPQLIGRKAILTLTVSEYRYPEGHAKYGQVRYSNDVSRVEQADIPEMFQPAYRRT